MSQFNNASNLIKNTEIMLQGLNAQQGWAKGFSDKVTAEELEEAINRADIARKECITFLDWFISTSNPSLPDLLHKVAFQRNTQLHLGQLHDPMPDASAGFIRITLADKCAPRQQKLHSWKLTILSCTQPSHDMHTLLTA